MSPSLTLCFQLCEEIDQEVLLNNCHMNFTGVLIKDHTRLIKRENTFCVFGLAILSNFGSVIKGLCIIGFLTTGSFRKACAV